MEPFLCRGIRDFFLSIPDLQEYAQCRNFQVGFYNMPNVSKLRDLKSTSVGKLCSVHGTVTRTTEVKPELQSGSFKCLECNTITQKVVQQFKYTEPVRCANERCENRTKWEVIPHESDFLDWQKMRV